jgi:hypothetical protein
VRCCCCCRRLDNNNDDNTELCSSLNIVITVGVRRIHVTPVLTTRNVHTLWDTRCGDLRVAVQQLRPCVWYQGLCAIASSTDHSGTDRRRRRRSNTPSVCCFFFAFFAVLVAFVVCITCTRMALCALIFFSRLFVLVLPER